MARRVLDYDENNNERLDLKEQRVGKRAFIERHLELGGEDDFLIIPNGGSGDCMFKTVSQAVYNGDESKHKTIRKKVVEFITKERWEKFCESIEVQHINGNNLLQRHWAKDPKQAYKMYMALDGTLGASSELTAAGELFRYNFATIQEYCTSTQRTYRVENCILFDESSVKFHYFYFTGDYDNGHWEYLKNLSNAKIEDGTYNGLHRTIIDGEEISVEDWFQRETENDNEADRLKIATNRAHFLKTESIYPFESNLFRFNEDKTVTLNGDRYKIDNEVESTDLFSVLAHACLQNEAVAHEAELVLMKHRYSYFEDINYKLITQPYSHNFTIEAIRYCGHPCKGNIQDLISAADLYSFSFILFMKLNKNSTNVHKCKFTHVDRWGGESDRILYFFVKLAESEQSDEVVARWWRLIPQDENGNVRVRSRPDTPTRKSKQKHEGGDLTLSKTSSVNIRASRDKLTRPRSAELHGMPRKSSLSRSSISGTCAPARTTSRVSFQDVKTLPALEFQSPFPIPEYNTSSKDTNRVSCQSECLFENEDGMETDECIQRDHANIFGSQSSSSKLKSRKGSKYSKDGKLVKKRFLTENIKRATGKDLLEHPEKVKTLVRLSDRTGSGREITYTGSGVLRADDVLVDLNKKGLIKFPMSKKASSYSFATVQKGNNDRKLDMLTGLERRHKNFDSLRTLRDENLNNIVQNNPKKTDSDSDVSYEHFVQETKKKNSTTETQTNREADEIIAVSKDYLRHQDKNSQPVKLKKSKVVPEVEPERNASTSSLDECNACTSQFFNFLLRIFSGIKDMCLKTKAHITPKKWKSKTVKNRKLNLSEENIEGSEGGTTKNIP